MAIIERYVDPNDGSDLNDGTTEALAWETIEHAVSEIADIYSLGDPQDGVTLHCKRLSGTGRYSFSGGTVTISEHATLTAPLVLRGYAASPGDGGLFAFSGRIEVTANMVAIIGFDGVAAGYGRCYRFNDGLGGLLYRCRGEAASKHGVYLYRSGGLALCCDFTSANGSAMHIRRGAARLCRAVSGSGSYAIDNSADYASASVAHCLVSAPSGTGIRVAGTGSYGYSVSHNIVYDCVDGIDVSNAALSGSGFRCVDHNIIWDVTNGIVGDVANAAVVVAYANAIGHVTSSRLVNKLRLFDDIVLTASPFVDYSGGDFTVNNDPGGGALLRAAGFPVQMAYDWDTLQPIATYEGSGGGGGGVSLSRVFGGL
jgi:hypothetical protein